MYTKMVENMLEQYRYMKRKADVLMFELAHPKNVSGQEVIECLALAHSFGETVSSSSGKSDKTMKIALQYEEIAKRLNDEAYGQLSGDHYRITVELNRLEHYVGLLDEPLAEIIRLHYFEGLNWLAVTKRLDISESTANRRKRTAIAEIAKLYEIIGWSKEV